MTHPSHRAQHRTILFAFNRVLKRDEVKRVREIAENNGAELVYWGKNRETHHTGWFTYQDIGSPFTDRASLAIRAELEQSGISLST